MRYFALDFETANSDHASICQIGLAEIHPDTLEINKVLSAYVDPDDYFSGFNIGIHGITEADVAGAGKFPDFYLELRKLIGGNVVIHHMPFEITAVNKVLTKYDLPAFPIHWIDSAKVVRRTWRQFSRKGYGLKNIADYLNISFGHHDAYEDAAAAAKVVLHALQVKSLPLERLFELVK